ncbi:hypothetical protein C6503_24710 [Candidatus Poribacteria bacterium]|nr:MAG: hypothetical protein C6503_24710 [Candidatus Poribacteria bacterium]
MTIIDEKYLNEISKFISGYAFRGQANNNWQLHSGATRRLIKHYHENIIQAPDFPQIYANYHSDVLIKPAQTNGFDIDDGYQISDLQLLAKLQHFEAATGLLDFTWNPLVALWFACKDNEDCDGKVFGINLRDPLRFQQVPNEAKKQSTEAIFLPGANADKLLYWEPKLYGEAAPRILRQRSVFVIGRPLIPEDILQYVEIRASDKALIKKELEDIFDISERTLFMDMPGFSAVNKAESPVPQIEDPAYYFFLANQFYQQGDYSQAVDSYSKCIDLEPSVSETYFLRGNAKAEMKNYPDAKQDYDLAIHHRDRPFRNWDPNTNILFNPILWMVYLNRGNIKAELNDYEGALTDYDEALEPGPLPQPPVAFFNRANIKVILHRFEDAIKDYNETIRLGATPNAYFNKGNTLVILGRFHEAFQCYDEAIRVENDRTDAVNNRDRVAEILNLIGDTESEIHLTQIGDNNTEGLIVNVQVPSNDLPERMFAFQGNIGNTGNFGYNSPGGGGFGGKMGFTVRVRGSQS